MEKLQKTLQQKVTAPRHITLKHTEQFTIPMQVLHVTYAPVERVTMDILMKMLLLTFSRIRVTNLQTVSDLLAVEHLFVEDLTTSLIRNELVSYTDSYQLTMRGEQQLADGIFENAQEEQQATLIYSPLHERFIDGSHDTLYDYDLPEPYPHLEEEALQQLQVAEEAVMTKLQQLQPATDGIQTYISSLRTLAIAEVIEVPCLAFVLYNEQEETFFTRIWNVLFESYDDVLEAHYTEHEIANWRTKFL